MLQGYSVNLNFVGADSHEPNLMSPSVQMFALGNGGAPDFGGGRYRILISSDGVYYHIAADLTSEAYITLPATAYIGIQTVTPAPGTITMHAILRGYKDL